MTARRATAIVALTGLGTVVASTGVLAHEAWLLTPEEMIELSRAPLPTLFSAPFPAFFIVVALASIAAAAVVLETQWATIEQRLLAPIATAAAEWAPFILRLGLAIMLLTAGLALLPAHGTAIAEAPTLFVPDMQLRLLDGYWIVLAPLQVLIGLGLASGFATRLMAALVIALSLLGLLLFGTPFVSYLPHFVAPAALILVVGSGRLALLPSAPVRPAWVVDLVHRLALAATGLGFVWLALSYKFQSPQLLMAILRSGEVPTFGMPLDLAALVMGSVELIAGLVLATGLLVRPVSLVLVGAFTFFAISLGESPLLHANLYATAFVFALVGRGWPLAAPLTADRQSRASVSNGPLAPADGRARGPYVIGTLSRGI
ncbi:MAG: hypothetical protein GC150_03500 [Rhizobiales bacterium]|nr:hypothetical protein [Hyphomicrobiales bacterium]